MKRFSINLRMMILLLTMSTLLSASFSYSTEDTNGSLIYTMTIEGIITNGTTDYITRSIQLAEEDHADALVMLINTPGGLVDATLTIIESMLISEVPIITYVAPQGAIAASAGSFILVAGHMSVMSPGTTSGAAMPVTMGFSEEGSTTTTADEKTINFLAGHIGSIAKERERNSDMVEKFVTENLTLSPQEALDNNIIDYIADDLPTLLDEVNGTELVVNGQPYTLNTSNRRIVPIEKTLPEKATSIIGNPQISFLLVLIGIYGLVIGFNAPETYLPEVAGVIAFMAGLYGLGMFEVNLFAALMLLLGVALLIAEVLTPTYGVLSTGGIISIILGGIFLPSEPLMPSKWFANLASLVIGLGIGASLVMVIILRAIIRIRRTKAIQGEDEFSGRITTILAMDEKNCTVMVRGELWQGKFIDNGNYELGQKVEVVSRKGIHLILQPVHADT